MPPLQKLFLDRYQKSLEYYRAYYDDIAEYGPRDHASHTLYFIPGFNGVPGQIRFAFPSLTRVLGRNFYAKCLWVPEFSAWKPKWEKFTADNLEKRWATIVNDLSELASTSEKIIVIASSTGFYDFLAAYRDLPESVRAKLVLAWVAVAPDAMKKSIWERFFFALNGVEKEGHLWWSYPNSNALAFLNPECEVSYRWRDGSQRKRFFKHDLESRFHLWGISWDYGSTDCANWVLQQCLQRFDGEPLPLPSFVLAATADGYWQKKPQSAIDATIRKYLSHPVIVYKKNSHLWVTEPQNLTELLELIVSI